MSRIFLLSCTLISALLALSPTLAEDKLIIASEGPLATWRPAQVAGARPAPGYPAQVADKSGDVCVGIGYLINSDGSTGNFTLLKSWSSKGLPVDDITPFAQQAIGAVQQWRFTPGEGFAGKPRPVYTAATFMFNGLESQGNSEVGQKCLIADLPDFIANLQSKSYKRGNLKKGLLDRDRVQNPPTVPLRPL